MRFVHHFHSLSAQVIAQAPVRTAAPPSFNGNNTLYGLNLFTFSAGFCLCLMFFLKLAIDRWKCARAPLDSEDHDEPKSPMQILRLIGMFWTGAYTIRCGSGAQALWRWNPDDPAASGAAIDLQRVLDPIAANIGYVGLALLFLALPGITSQLRNKPYPVDMWLALPELKRPACVIALCLIAAVGVVVTR